MTEPRPAGSAIGPLLRILAISVPVFVACFFLSGLHDLRGDAASTSAAAVSARLQPVSHIEVASAAQAKK